jgi:hypothetical protein
MHKPGPHQGIISFPGVDCRLLRAPAQSLQPTGQVVGMVAHPKGHQDHRPDAPERPPIRVKASFESAFVEDGQHALPLLNAQAGGPTGNGTCIQAGHVALMLTKLLSPFADGHPTDPQSTGNVGVGELTGLEQPSSLQASFFTLTTGEVSWAPDHGHPL